MRKSTGLDVTVVIPTFNYGRFLAHAVDSVLNQAGQHAAVIVVDDGSTDRTSAVAADYGDRIRYLRQDNQGVSAARNRGIAEVQTEWVIFLDADDRLLPNALQHFASSIQEHPSAKLHFGRHISLSIDGSRKESKRLPEIGPPLENFRRLIQRRFTISTGTACYHRDVFRTIRYPVGITHGEHILVDGQVLANFPAATIPHPLAEILDHAGRSRDNLEQLKRCGVSTAVELFDPNRLPAEALKLKPLFLARWNLTLARACYRSGDYSDARCHYEQAAANRWTSVFHPTHGVRYLKSILRAALTPIKDFVLPTPGLLSVDAPRVISR